MTYRFSACSISIILMPCIFVFFTSCGNNSVELTEDNFPDDAFCEYLADNFDTDEDGKLSEEEIDEVKDLELKNLYEMKSVEGIELLTSLQSLAISDSHIENLDLSGCKSLKSLVCQDNREMKKLNVSGCESIEEIMCGGEKISSDLIFESHLQEINISGCKNLKKLNIEYSDCLTALNFQGCESLTELKASHCKNMERFDLSDCKSLVIIEADYCEHLSELLLPRSGQLMKLSCNYCNLTTIDLTACNTLNELKINENHIESIDLNKCPHLTTLECGSNDLSELDLTAVRALDTLYCGDNKLSSLDVKGMSHLKELSCGANQIAQLDLSGCSALQTVQCQYNRLTSLSVADCPDINEIDIFKNNIGQEAVNALIKSLPDRGEVQIGKWYNRIEAVNYTSYEDSKENNFYWTKEQVDAARAKGWRVWNIRGEGMDRDREMYYWMEY